MEGFMKIIPYSTDCGRHLGCVDKDLWVPGGRRLQRHFQVGFWANSVEQTEGSVNVDWIISPNGFEQADESLDGSNVEGEEGAAAEGEEGLNNQEGTKKAPERHKEDSKKAPTRHQKRHQEGTKNASAM